MPHRHLMPIALGVVFAFIGCDKVDRLKQTIADKAGAAAKKATNAPEETPPATPASAAAPAGAPAPAPDPAAAADDAPAAGDNAGAAAGTYDAKVLADIRAVGTCARAIKSECEVFAKLEASCRAARKTAEASPASYERMWRTLVHGVATATHRNSRYAAAFLANRACQVPASLKGDEAVGRKLLDALKREGKEGYGAGRIAELLSNWWRTDLPKLHADMEALLMDRSHGVPDARKGLAQLGGIYAAKRESLATALITVALAEGDDVNVREAAVGHLARITHGEHHATEALAALKTLAAAQAGQLTMPAFAGLGDAGAVSEWPNLVARWRKDKMDPLVGGALAKATWRYSVAKYPSDAVGVPQRLAAFDVAVEVLNETAVPADARTWALYTLQQSGHPNAAAALKRVAKGPDEVLAREAKGLLERVSPVDPALAAGVGKSTRVKPEAAGSAKATPKPARRPTAPSARRRAPARHAPPPRPGR